MVVMTNSPSSFLNVVCMYVSLGLVMYGQRLILIIVVTILFLINIVYENEPQKYTILSKS